MTTAAPAATNIGQEILAFFAKAWGDLENIAATDWEWFKGWILPLITAMTPALWQILLNVVETVLAKTQSNDQDEILQAVLQEAEQQGLTWITELEENVLKAAIGLIQLKAAA